jgi:hypothetical protein
MVFLSPRLWRNIVTENARAGRASDRGTIVDLSAHDPDNGVPTAAHVAAT